MYRQERDTDALWASHNLDCEAAAAQLKPRWDEGCTWCEMDFLHAALQFRQLSIRDALHSDNYIIRIFAILDRRVGKRTLQSIAAAQEYAAYPDWVKQFYELRLCAQLEK